jgi:hypothetical protein
MGCDIHCYVEKRSIPQDGLGDGYPSIIRWEKIGGFQSDWYDPDCEYFDKKIYESEADSPIDRKNYLLFSVLADVRNSSSMISPISSPKGLPHDVSSPIKVESEEWGADGHSHSYLTLKELLEYDYNQEIKKSGWVDKSQFKEYVKVGSPSLWCGDIGGGNVTKIPQEEMLEKVKTGDFNSNHDYYTEVSWTIKLSDYLGKYLEDSLPQLVERSENGNFDDVRIVFWFDS